MERAALVCLLASVFGLLGILFFLRSSPPGETVLLSGEDAGRVVFFKGKVVSFSEGRSGFFLYVCGKPCASVFVPRSVAEKTALDWNSVKGRFAEVKGLVSEDDEGLRVTVFEPDAVELMG